MTTPLHNIIKTQSESGSGCYGAYYYLSSGKGVKVLDERFPSKKEALNSETFQDALKEKYFLNLLTRRQSDFTPKCYGVLVFKYKGNYRIGIILQHLGDQRMADIVDELREQASSSENDNDRFTRYSKIEARMDKIKELLRKKLNFFGIGHHDLHGKNVMYYKNKFWVIDFTPSMINEYKMFSNPNRSKYR